MAERGEFIFFEGADFAGKTAQVNMLKEAWKNRDDVIFLREPGGSLYGEEVRKLLFFPPEVISPMVELMLFTSIRRHNVETIIEPALAEGKTVVSDRTWYSSLGYQGGGGEISLEEITDITAKFLPEWYMYSQKGIVLTVPTEERLRRKASRDFQDGKIDAFEKQDEEYFERVNDIYNNYIIGKLGARGISGVGDRLEIHQDILEAIS
jgi:dTMP kinase